MPDAEELLEELLEKQLELVRARKGSAREQALEDRIAKLEGQLSKKPKTEIEDAAEELELDDDELSAVKEFLAERRKGSVAHGTSDDAATDDEAGNPPKPKTRPGRKSGQVYKWTVDEDGNVVALDIPTVFSGEDEPDKVELPAAPDDADAEDADAA